MDADTAIMAIGYKADPIISSTTPGIKTRSGGLLLADEKTGATDRKASSPAATWLPARTSLSPPWSRDARQPPRSIVIWAGSSRLPRGPDPKGRRAPVLLGLSGLRRHDSMTVGAEHRAPSCMPRRTAV